jgi:hypothetical protein
MTTTATLTIWKTIKLGTGFKNAEDFCNALEKAHCRVGYAAKAILTKPEFSAAIETTKLNLTVVSVAELGFEHGTAYEVIIDRAIMHGLELCPNEVGPQLRLQYLDQPFGECLHIAMRAITHLDGRRRIFGVDCDGGECSLFGLCGDLKDLFYPADRFVFVLPQ